MEQNSSPWTRNSCHSQLVLRQIKYLACIHQKQRWHKAHYAGNSGNIEACTDWWKVQKQHSYCAENNLLCWKQFYAHCTFHQSGHASLLPAWISCTVWLMSSCFLMNRSCEWHEFYVHGQMFCFICYDPATTSTWTQWYHPCFTTTTTIQYRLTRQHQILTRTWERHMQRNMIKAVTNNRQTILIAKHTTYGR